MTNRCFVLGLTGSIGMGKSTTAQMFRDLGVPVWDADQAVAVLYGPDGGALAALAAIDPSFVRQGIADRDAMKQAISGDSAVLAAIEEAVHPLVRASRVGFLKENRTAGLVVLDIPLLFETGAEDQVDAVLVVTAPEDVQYDRVMARGTMTPDMFKAIRAKQLPDDEKRQRADYVIETLTLEGTKADVTSLVKELRAKHA